ncbi:MAG: sulfate adenylyltransferase subunit 2 [Elusimicrobia bacterium]|nr:sulfate adenylyltransferase subunit 2 [Elusimicrobiota bacterium]
MKRPIPVSDETIRLRELENESIYIIREAYRKFKKPAMLWSMGKDSCALLWLVRKAFFGRTPFPVVHIDTTYKMPEMIKFRDEKAAQWGLDLVVVKNRAALKAGISPARGKLKCCTALKTHALRELLKKEKYNAVLLAIRRDEEGTRAKERCFSPRGGGFEWDFKDQPPELWDQFQTDSREGAHIRVHPLLHWTEADVWKYIRQENIPVIKLYFAKNGKRYRSLGCLPCTAPINSRAATIDDIILELETILTSERAGRAQDKAGDYAMQKLRVEGYM